MSDGRSEALFPLPAYAVVANLLTGSFVIEQIFALPGIGRHFVQSITNRDYTVIMGITIFYAAFLMLMILIVDLLYLWLDPRISYGDRQ